MIIDCISDLHGHYPKLEGGDLLIVAGDLTADDKYLSYVRFGGWIAQQRYKKKIVIAGNHDAYIQRSVTNFPEDSGGDVDGFFEQFGATYLFDSGTDFVHYWPDERNILTARNYKIWGSPWTRWFPAVNPTCTAFMLKSEDHLAEHWALVPEDTDILVTHGPPYAILDAVHGKGVGSESLRRSVIAQIRPLLHVYGHIHEGYGTEEIPFTVTDAFQKNPREGVIKFVNASYVNEHYEPVNAPVRVVI